MLKIFFSASLFLSLPVFADIDAAFIVEPKVERVEAARSCFSELEKLGCGHPKDDQDHFKKCMTEVFSTIDPNCQLIMKRLYGK